MSWKLAVPMYMKESAGLTTAVMPRVEPAVSLSGEWGTWDDDSVDTSSALRKACGCVQSIEPSTGEHLTLLLIRPGIGDTLLLSDRLRASPALDFRLPGLARSAEISCNCVRRNSISKERHSSATSQQ